MNISNPRVAAWLPHFFPLEHHPFIVFERRIAQRLAPHHTLLDAGCGRTAELARRFSSCVSESIGIDQVDFDTALVGSGIRLLTGDLCALPLTANSVDTIVARAVMEHLSNPLAAYREARRVLRPGGRFLFLTPSDYHYATIAAKLIPNRYHASIVKRVENRPECDTFETHYRSNSRSVVKRLAEKSGLEIVSIDFLGQYPGYLTFNSLTFLLGTAYEKTVDLFDFLGPLRRWLLVELQRAPDSSV